MIFAQMKRNRSPVVDVLIAAFVLRTALVLFHVFVMHLPGSGVDDASFDSRATLWASEGLSGALGHYALGARLYIWLISLVFAIFGHTVGLVLMGNVILSVAIIFLTYRITLEVTGSQLIARRVGWALVAFPTFVFYSVLMMREMAEISLFISGVLAAVLWLKRQQVRWLGLALGCFVGSVMFHGGMVFALIAVAIAAAAQLLRGMRQMQRQTTAGAAVGLIVTGVMISYTWASGVASNKLDQFDSVMDKGITARGRSAYLEDWTFSSPADFVTQSPVRSVFFLFTPFPWMVHQFLDLLGLIDAMVYMWAIYRIIKGWRSSARTPEQGALAIFLVAGILMFASGTSNYGTAMRHRLKLVPVLLVLAAVPSAERSAAKARKTARKTQRLPAKVGA